MHTAFSQLVTLLLLSWQLPSVLAADAFRCFLGFFSLGFDVNALDRYDEFYREDSVFEVPQIGIYQGPEDIKEYISFGVPMFSPYFADDTQKTTVEFAGYDEETRQCEFLSMINSRYELDPDTTWDGSSLLNVVIMTKLFFNLNEGYIARANLYFPPPAAFEFFGVRLNSDNTRNYVCSVMSNQCSGIVDSSNCISQLEALPLAEGDYNAVDGYTQGCRTFHAAFAEVNPINHCPHLSFTPIEDPQGRIKCQTTANANPYDLFTEKDIASYEVIAKKFGIDPDLGYMPVNRN